jgi:C-terminal processing protease CtpA/Prc/Tol biopolymer transport system component
MRFLIGAIALTAAVSAQAGPVIKRIKDPAISPDGASIAFEWQGDIWTVPTEGGMATRVTVHPADESMPVWSPDGRTIYFGSTRHGSLDVFTVGADGTHLRRLTFDSGSEYPWSASDGHVYGYGNKWGRLDLFRVPVTGGSVVKLTGEMMEMEYYPDVSPDGKQVLFNTSGSPSHWRYETKSGANTARVWIADTGAPLRSHKKITEGEAYDLFPVWSGSDTFACVSNRSGMPNVWEMGLDGSKKQLTSHDSGTVRRLTVSVNGSKLAYQHDSALWVYDKAKGAEAEVVVLAPSDSRRDAYQHFSLTTGAEQFAVSPDGKRGVFSLRGNLYLIPAKGGTTRALTTTFGPESDPIWLDDERVLHVAAGENSKRELRITKLDGTTELFVKDEQELLHPKLSPDGKQIALHRGMKEIVVIPVEGGELQVAHKASYWRAPLGEQAFNWTPDSKGLIVNNPNFRGFDAKHVDLETGKETLIARVGKDMNQPAITPDGRTVIFGGVQGFDYSEPRLGTKTPLYAVDLIPQSITFTEDDLDAIGEKKEPIKNEPFRIVERGIEQRLRQITTGSATAGPWISTSGTIYANVDGKLVTVTVNGGTPKPVVGATGPAQSVSFSKDGKTAYVVSGGKLMSINAGTAKAISFKAEFDVDQAKEEEALFQEVWRNMKMHFYDPAMHGKDWDGIHEQYAALVPHAQSRGDFYSLMNEMVYRLDSSHQGASATGGFRAAHTESTGRLGVEWDWTTLDASGEYIVGRVLAGSPASHPDSLLRSGDKVVTINGQKPTPSNPAETLLNGTTGKKVRIKVTRNGTEREVVIKPASQAAMSGLGYEDWVNTNRAYVDKRSNGRLAYLHIQSMNASSLGKFYTELSTKTQGKEGAIIDVRYNGGGFTAHIVLSALSKKLFLHRTTKDNPRPYSEGIFRGNSLELPTAAMINQYSFSNAEIFAEGFRTMGLGPIIGEPTSGAVISTYGSSLWDGGSLRLPAMGIYDLRGENLETNGRKPDVYAPFDLNGYVKGKDSMLDAAVDSLLKKL